MPVENQEPSEEPLQISPERAKQLLDAFSRRNPTTPILLRKGEMHLLNGADTPKEVSSRILEDLIAIVKRSCDVLQDENPEGVYADFRLDRFEIPELRERILSVMAINWPSNNPFEARIEERLQNPGTLPRYRKTDDQDTIALVEKGMKLQRESQKLNFDADMIQAFLLGGSRRRRRQSGEK